jgi:hypothetical protein
LATFTVGDTAPDLTGSLGIDLTGATVEVHVRKPSGTVISSAVTVTEAATGEWAYEWQADDLDEAGVWAVEAQVTFAGGDVQTSNQTTFRVKDQIA